MDRQFISRFLEKYKSLPCLWKIKSEEYKNKSLRCSAYNELLALTKEYYQEADLDYVKKKINNLRTTFRKELRKYHQSIGSSDIYTPTLWYFDLLYFVEDQETDLNDDEDTENSINTSVDFGTEKPINFYIQENDPLDAENKNISMSKILNSPEICENQELPSRKRSNDQKRFQSHSCSCQEDSFGAYVASRLKTMEKYQRVYAEHIISNVLFHGAIGDLTANSTVNNLDNSHRIFKQTPDQNELSLDIKTEMFDQTI